MESRKLIVGCGYVGLRVAREYAKHGEQVFALTRSAERARQFTDEGIQGICGDVTDPESLAALPACDELVFAVGFDRTAGIDKRRVYVDGLVNTLEQLARCRPRVTYVSSISVYGQSDGELIDETSVCEPSTDGGRICLDAENSLAEICAQHEMAYSILRLAGIYGPGRLLRRAESLRKSEPIGGNPDGWLNLIHGDDAASAVVSAGRLDSQAETFVVADNRPIRRREYFSKLAALIDAPAPIFDASAAPTNRPVRPGINKRCSNQKLRDRLLSELRYPDIDSGLPHAIANSAAG